MVPQKPLNELFNSEPRFIDSVDEAHGSLTDAIEFIVSAEKEAADMSVYSITPGNRAFATVGHCLLFVLFAFMTWSLIAVSDGVAAEPQSTEFSLPCTRDVIDRALSLAARLKCSVDVQTLAPLVADLETLDHRLTKLAGKGDVSEDDKREIYRQASSLKRRIAFANPLLNIDKLLFIKRHDAAGVFHMCDQYYGCNAVPGGGLYVLADPFGPEPELTNVLADAIVENGRLKGQKLEGGSFLSPELSFDGQTILFAYTEAKAWNKYQGKEAYEWKPEYSFHIFKCRADGTGLVQLTDGPSDDFDPCFLPNGRIAFISERRGGFLRCGRNCPVYTLHSMEPDGSDIIKLSFHETHEWHPSVANDGMLIYTRWDYVDRDTNIAHHIWTCFPDGRDPRSPHGNYPERRESRPWMEMSIRAVPDSHKFVGVTGAHHGHAFGSLILIDPHVLDDNAESQLVRLTPEVPFAEAEGGKSNVRKNMVYGTPWPLSEDDFLCVYDDQSQNYGLYWVDRFGNRELIYRDPQISCLDPIPLRPRFKPPTIPDQTIQTAAAIRSSASDRDQRATIAVMNVYDADFAWPEGTTIEALRVIQVLPKTTPPPNQPRIGIASQTNAPYWERFPSKKMAVSISKLRPARRSISRRSTSAAWPCSRCGVARICTQANEWSVWVVTNVSRDRRWRWTFHRWPCSERRRRLCRMWTVPVRLITSAWCSRCWNAIVSPAIKKVRHLI